MDNEQQSNIQKIKKKNDKSERKKLQYSEPFESKEDQEKVGVAAAKSDKCERKKLQYSEPFESQEDQERGGAAAAKNDKIGRKKLEYAAPFESHEDQERVGVATAKDDKSGRRKLQYAAPFEDNMAVNNGNASRETRKTNSMLTYADPRVGAFRSGGNFQNSNIQDQEIDQEMGVANETQPIVAELAEEADLKLRRLEEEIAKLKSLENNTMLVTAQPIDHESKNNDSIVSNFSFKKYKKIMIGALLLITIVTAITLVVYLTAPSPSTFSPSTSPTETTLSPTEECYTGTHDEVTEWCNGRCCVDNNNPGANGTCVFHDKATICVGSCIGAGACATLGSNTEVLKGSCIGYHSCRYLGDDVRINTGSCQGSDACHVFGASAVSSIGDNSCIGLFSCQISSNSNMVIGDNSCAGSEACRGFAVGIGGGNAKIIIGRNSCRASKACIECENRGHSTVELPDNSTGCDDVIYSDI